MKKYFILLSFLICIMSAACTQSVDFNDSNNSSTANESFDEKDDSSPTTTESEEQSEAQKSYTITLDLNGGNIPGNITSIEVRYGEEYDFGTPTKANYQFDGWVYDGKPIAIKGMWKIDGNITVIATWDSWTPII